MKRSLSLFKDCCPFLCPCSGDTRGGGDAERAVGGSQGEGTPGGLAGAGQLSLWRGTVL